LQLGWKAWVTAEGPSASFQISRSFGGKSLLELERWRRTTAGRATRRDRVKSQIRVPVSVRVGFRHAWDLWVWRRELPEARKRTMFGWGSEASRLQRVEVETGVRCDRRCRVGNQQLMAVVKTYPLSSAMNHKSSAARVGAHLRTVRSVMTKGRVDCWKQKQEEQRQGRQTRMRWA